MLLLRASVSVLVESFISNPVSPLEAASLIFPPLPCQPKFLHPSAQVMITVAKPAFTMCLNRCCVCYFTENNSFNPHNTLWNRWPHYHLQITGGETKAQKDKVWTLWRSWQMVSWEFSCPRLECILSPQKMSGSQTRALVSDLSGSDDSEPLSVP